MYVGTRRNGAVHFWCNFLGTKKVYKVENQLLVDYSERRGRDWLLRSRWSLRLTPFPSARRRGPCKPTAQKVASHSLCFSHLCLQASLRQGIKNKRYRFLDTFLLRGLAEREGFEPPVQLPVHRISSAARSTTPASFQGRLPLIEALTDCKNSNFF